MDTQGDLSNWPFPIFNPKSKMICSQSELLSTNSLLSGPLVGLMFFPQIWSRKWGEIAKKNHPECVTEQPSMGALTGQGSFASCWRNHRKNFEHWTKPEKKTCTQIDALLWIYDCWNKLVLKEWDEISLKLCIAERMAGVKDLTCLVLR